MSSKCDECKCTTCKYNCYECDYCDGEPNITCENYEEYRRNNK